MYFFKGMRNGKRVERQIIHWHAIKMPQLIS